MSDSNLSSLEQGSHYTAQALKDFLNTSDAAVLSSNEEELFTDLKREYKVVHQFKGCFEGGNYQEKRTYIVEKV
ncbi:hypothetical protein ACFOU0_09240 [Salinicoccus sesuvii]|uniref:Uncharacterized protein n=1 Tax=Salinicoccus sesuvii TaxID=868281 RepID=A0ABV7N6J0_9STAP